MLLIAVQEKKARIEVGYGLEGVLTDAQSRLIIANDVEPYLAKDDVAGAARHGLDAILAVVHPAPFAEPVVEKPGLGWLLGVGLFMLILALIVIGILQAILLAIPAARRRIAEVQEASRRGTGSRGCAFLAAKAATNADRRALHRAALAAADRLAAAAPMTEAAAHSRSMRNVS